MGHKARFHSKTVIEKKEEENVVVDEDDEITKIESSSDFEKHCYDVISASIAPELLVTVTAQKEKQVVKIGAAGVLTTFHFTKLFSALAKHGYFLDVLGKKVFVFQS